MSDFFLYRHAWISVPHFERQLSDEECDTLLEKGGWMVRNTYDFDQREESDFWYVIKDSFDGINEHSPNERNRIRRALRRFDYRIIDKQLVESHGYAIAQSAYDDYYVRDRKMNKAFFNHLLESWSEENHEFWGAFDVLTDKLVGFSAVRIFKNACFYEFIAFLPEYKYNKTYPYYGFYFKRNEYYLGERKVRYVTDGSRSITEHSDIQLFLIQKFKFRKAYCKLKIHYKWWFGIVVRMLFPFRNIIPNKSIKAVLKMHEMMYKGN